LLTKVTRCHLLRLLGFPVLVFPVGFFLGGPAFLVFAFLDRVVPVNFGDPVVRESPVDFSSDFSYGSGVSIATNPIRRSK
jgi:hypothetical protein